MTLYEFTVHLDRAPDDAGADQLFEVGLDDATVCDSPDGRAWLRVARRAETLTDALLSVVADIEQAGFQPTGIDAEDLVSLSVIGQRTGRTRESARLLATGQRGPGAFPRPAVSGKHPLYSWATVRDWFYTRYGDETIGAADQDSDTLAAADLLLRARLLAPDPKLARLVMT